MAREILGIPEEHVRDVISVIRAGLNEVVVHEDVAASLTEWCDSEETYLDRKEDDVPGESIWEHVRRAHPKMVEADSETGTLRNPGMEFEVAWVYTEYLKRDHAEAHRKENEDGV